MKKSALKLLLVFSGAIICGASAQADPIGSTVYFVRASKDLVAGTMLIPSNVSIGQANDTKQMPPCCMWLTKPDEAYGFKMHHARGKGEAITGYDLLLSVNPSGAIKSTDPVWSQYAKSSVLYDKKHEFSLSRKYEEAALIELDKLAKANQHLMFMDDEQLIFEMLRHAEEEKLSFASSLEESKKRLASLRSPLAVFNLDKLKEEQKKLESERLEKSNKKTARDKRIYGVLSKMLPPTCQVLQFIKKDLQNDSNVRIRSSK